jgi:hypothetical protein
MCTRCQRRHERHTHLEARAHSLAKGPGLFSHVGIFRCGRSELRMGVKTDSSHEQLDIACVAQTRRRQRAKECTPARTKVNLARGSDRSRPRAEFARLAEGLAQRRVSTHRERDWTGKQSLLQEAWARCGRAKAQEALGEGVIDIGIIMFVILLSGPVGYAIILEQTPQIMTEWMVGLSSNPTVRPFTLAGRASNCRTAGVDSLVGSRMVMPVAMGISMSRADDTSDGVRADCTICPSGNDG